MEVNCEGCAGCCIDWRPVATGALDHERRGSRQPLDDTYNLVPLTRDEVRGFLEDGLGDVMAPRLWRADGSGDADAVAIDGVDVVAIGDRPVFFVGLRKVPKPVAPFGVDPTWLETCVFLDPETLQCRIHGDPRYPDECADYPGHNLALGVETECERVESQHGGERLLDDDPGGRQGGLLLGPHAVGAKVFVHPEPARLEGVVDRIAAGEATPGDRAEFVGVAAASTPGTTAVDGARAARARERVLAADSWAGRVIDEWQRRSDTPGAAVAAAGDDGDNRDGGDDSNGGDNRDGGDDDSDGDDSGDGGLVDERAQGAPGTPGW